MSEETPKKDGSDPSTQKADEDIEAKEKDTVAELNQEEQMALYEKSLKEDDWGHQPC